ncbi:hypothetical protein [Streptomyces sp. NPDC001604]|uniref:hypothetical protein n=1 Tax=Streptomyces sp. NPDC001604 TaxID=3364593 RepID=UPI0036C0A2BA
MPSPRPSRSVHLLAAAAATELPQAEHVQLRCALAAQSTIHMAEGALAVLGSVPFEDARRVLARLARTLGLDVYTVAEHVLTLAQAGPVPQTVIDEMHRVLARYRT